MKYTIEGFSQEVALALGLDAIDLVLLRWIVDFYNTDKMEKHYWEQKEYFWVNYQSLIADMPILGISNKMALRRRLRKIEKAGIVEFKVFQGAGNRTFYRFSEGILSSLLSNKTRGGLDPNVKRVLTQMSRGSGQKCQALYKDPSTIDPSTKDKYLQEVSNFFDNPDQTWLESLVKCYPKIDLKAEFNKMKAWLISNPNNSKKNLKRFVVNWLNHPQKERQNMPDNLKIDIFLNERLGRIATKDMIKAVMIELPEDLWWKVDDFLRRRYPGSDGRAFAEVKHELMAGAGENKAKIKGLTNGIGKEVGAMR